MIYRLILIFYIALFGSAIAQTLNATDKEKLKIKAQKIDFINRDEGEREIYGTGDVEIDYTNYNLCSKSVLINEKTDKIEAQGGVILTEKQGGLILKTEKTRLNKDFSKASIDQFTFEKDQLYGDSQGGEKNEKILTFKDFRASSCSSGRDGGRAEWRVKAKEANYNTESGEINLKNTIVYAEDIPVFWLPYYSINPNKTYGFLAPKIELNQDYLGLTTPFFITEKTKTHYFLFSPQFLYQKKDAPYKKVNNYGANYTYKKNNTYLNLDFLIAPSSYIQNNLTGNLEDSQKDRYGFSANFSYNLKDGLFGVIYNDVSDRFFRNTYKGITENYLTNKVFINKAFENNSYLNIESANFIPIASPKSKKDPKIDAYLNYIDYIKYDKNLEFYYNPNIISISREEGVLNQSRLSNSFGLNYLVFDGILKTNINPELRIDIYAKHYQVSANEQKNIGITRFIPSIDIQNKIPIYFASSLSNNYIFNITPRADLRITKNNINTNEIENQDSGTILLTSQNLFANNSSFGYDLVEEGTSFKYGTEFFIWNKKTNTRLDVFAGQKIQTFLGESNKINYSSYVGELKLDLSGLFTINNEVLVSTKGKLEYLDSSLSFKIWKANFNLSTLFIDKSLTKSNLDVKTDTFEVSFPLPKTSLNFKTILVQNRNFKNLNNEIERRIVSSSFGIFANIDCLQFEVGVKKLSYSNQDLQKGYGFYGTLSLLGI
jgi:lipopolysaccharide assembly outer membrane protein LptD (OstA)